MEYDVLISGYDHQGRGIARINNKICFIPNTLKDEFVKIKITKEKKKFIEAKVIEILKPSPFRQSNICPYYQNCGGCDLLHMPYKEQLKYKNNKIIDIMNRYVNQDIKINNIISSDKQFYYRNKVTLHSKNNKLGYFNKKSNDIIEIKHCKLIDEKLNDYLHNIKNYNKDIVLRTNGIEVLDSNKSIIKTIGKYQFKVSLDSFFQVNDNVTFKMYELIKKYCQLENKQNILDLYCGTGTIGIYVSECASNVLGIEINKQAVKDAFENKKINNINNIEFIADDVSKVINNIKFNPDIIIVDPPRAGLDKNSIDTIINIKPNRLIYTSCDPMTLARDLNLLKNNFQIEEITPFDMFPNTYHVECVCLLKLC